MNNNSKSAIVREASKQDFKQMIKLHEICFRPPFPQEIQWSANDLEFLLKNFPEGQLIVEIDNIISGHIISTRVTEKHYHSHPSLLNLAGTNPPWCNFNKNGNTMWILEIAVNPEFKGLGCARALVNACKEVVKETAELIRFGGGTRIPGYAKWKEKTGESPEKYCRKVIGNKVFDPVLGPFLKFGTKFDCVVADYIPDPDSLNFGASVIWEKDMK